MWISSLLVGNYRCFREPQRVSLGPGVNVVLGPNNSGKTALLEALSLPTASRGHRSLKTIPEPNQQAPNVSQIEITLTLSQKELGLMLSGAVFDLHWPPPASELADRLRLDYQDAESHKRYLNWFAALDPISVSMKVSGQQCGPTHLPCFQDTGLPIPSPDEQFTALRVANTTGSFTPQGVIRSGFSNELAVVLGNALKRRMRAFAPPQLAAQYPQHGECLVANPDDIGASLNQLGGNPHRLKRFNEAVRRLLPDLCWVDHQVRFWFHEIATEREDLTFQLPELGLGTRYLVALLFLLFKEEPAIVLIDEVNAYLHPGIMREVFRVFSQQRCVQLIVASNSPVSASLSTAGATVLVERTGNESRLRAIDASARSAQFAIMEALGVTPADVFGASGILWLEGKTEAKCFPEIAARLCTHGSGIIFRPMRATGDLEGKQAAAFFDIYEQVSGSTSPLMPPAVAYVLDSEKRTESDKTEIRNRAMKQGKASAYFLPRRMFENYLLDVDAISARLAVHLERQGADLTALHQLVKGKLHDLLEDSTLYSNGEVPELSKRIETVDAAELLKKLYSGVSDARVQFRKTDDSVQLTSWLLNHKPAMLDEIANLLDQIFRDAVARKPLSEQAGGQLTN